METGGIGLTAAEWQVMECLWEHAPRTGREATAWLAKKVGWIRSTTLTLLRRLEGQGLLTSEWETGGSKPRKYYRVTPEGREVCARLKAAWQATVESVQRAMETEWEGKTDEQGE